MSESTEELMERHLRELREFEDCNPTDVSFWPSPAEVIKEVMENGLTEEQEAVVEAGPFVAVKAGPGGGKTHALVARIARLVEKGADSQKIVAVSFTRKAAGELTKRLAKRGLTIGFSGTIHSYCLQLLNSQRQNPLSAAPQSLVDKLFHVEQSAAGSRMPVDKIVRRLDQQLEAQGLVSFDRILRMVCEKEFIHAIRYLAGTHLLVDEVQDSGVQEVEFYLNILPESFMIVGDFRQCLYGFRGADPWSLDRIAKAQAMEVLELTMNFRSTVAIQRLSQAALVGGSEYVTEANGGPHDLADIALQIAANPPDVVLAGQNATVESLASELKAYGLTVTGKSRPTEGQLQLEAYLRWQASPQNSALLEHLLGMIDPVGLTVARRIASTNLLELVDALPPNYSLFSPLQAARRDLENEHLTLSTLELAELVAEPQSTGEGLLVITCHAGKGLEWDSVCWVDDVGTSAHHNRMRFVACSRAKTRLAIYKLAGGYR